MNKKIKVWVVFNEKKRWDVVDTEREAKRDAKLMNEMEHNPKYHYLPATLSYRLPSKTKARKK